MLSVNLEDVQRASDAVRADWRSSALADDGGGAPGAEPPNSAVTPRLTDQVEPEAGPRGALATPAELEALHRRTPSASLAELEALDREGLLEKMPRAEDGSLTSVGSARHAEGKCAPCLFWFRKSCSKGLRCSYCHIRHEGLRNKRIRPSKQTRIKLREQMAANGETGPLAIKNSSDSRQQQQQRRPRKATGDGGSSSESSSGEEGEGEARRKVARTDIPPDLFLDAKGNSRPCWLRDDDPPGYGHSQYGCIQPQYSAPPEYGAPAIAPYSLPLGGAPHAGYGYAPAQPGYGQQQR